MTQWIQINTIEFTISSSLSTYSKGRKNKCPTMDYSKPGWNAGWVVPQATLYQLVRLRMSPKPGLVFPVSIAIEKKKNSCIFFYIFEKNFNLDFYNKIT